MSHIKLKCRLTSEPSRTRLSDAESTLSVSRMPVYGVPIDAPCLAMCCWSAVLVFGCMAVKDGEEEDRGEK